MAEYSVSTGDEGQHRCGRCRTFVESYDLMIGISSTTFGITGSRYWMHLDCVEQHQAQDLADSLDTLLQGYADLTADDQTLVSESLQDLSQGLNLHRWEKKKKEGRAQALHKHQETTNKETGASLLDASLSSSSSSSPSSPSSSAVVEPLSSFVSTESTETKTATPWYIVAQQKREQTVAKRKPEKLKSATTPQKKKQAKSEGSEKKKKKEKKEKKEGEEEEEQDDKKEEGEGAEAVEGETKEDGEGDEEDKVSQKRAKKEKKQAKREKKAQKKEKKEKEKQDTEKKEKKKREPKAKPAANELEGETSSPTKPAATKKKKTVNNEPLVGGPDKPKTEYWYYCASKRPALEQRGLGAQAINHELSEGWKSLEGSVRAEFEEYHSRDKKRYARQLQEFTQYGSFTLEIEQCDDPNICEALAKHSRSDSIMPMAVDKQVQTTLKNMFVAPPVVEVETRPQPTKRPGSFFKGAMKPVSRLG